MNRWLGISGLILGFLSALALGLIVEWHFPNLQQKLLHKAISKVRMRLATPDRVLAGQYVKDQVPVQIEGEMETALLPLRVKGLRLSDHYPIPKQGGSIAAMGKWIMVMDRLGNFYRCKSDGSNLDTLAFPPLPNNIRQYLEHVGQKYNDKSLRAHDLVYLEPKGALAVSHEYFDKQNRLTGLAVSVLKLDMHGESIRAKGSWETIYRSDLKLPSNIVAGGQMAFASPDRIYLGVGDYFIKSPDHPQDIDSSFGKILELRLDDKKARVVSVGHRNPQGLVNTKSGGLFATEHGPMGGDELNRIEEGGNYGWPKVTLGTEYGMYSWRDVSMAGSHEPYQAPIFAWVPSIAVASLIEVQDFHPRWDGDLLVASLKAETLFRLRRAQNRVMYAEPIWIGQRIRDLAQTQDGVIALWTEDSQLQLLSVDEARLASNARPTKQLNETLDTKCMFCHHFGPTNPTHAAPSLSGIFGRKIASDNFRYTAGLRAKEGSWTEDDFRDFLAKPAGFASGTAMPDLNLSQHDVDEIVAVLKEMPAPVSEDALRGGGKVPTH